VTGTESCTACAPDHVPDQFALAAVQVFAWVFVHLIVSESPSEIGEVALTFTLGGVGDTVTVMLVLGSGLEAPGKEMPLTVTVVEQVVAAQYEGSESRTNDVDPPLGTAPDKIAGPESQLLALAGIDTVMLFSVEPGAPIFLTLTVPSGLLGLNASVLTDDITATGFHEMVKSATSPLLTSDWFETGKTAPTAYGPEGSLAASGLTM